jgi:hypothetical protein
MPRGNAARGAWARDAHRTPRGELGKEHHAHQANHAGNHANHAHHSETQAARTHSTGGIRIAANGRAYAHSGSMHQDGRRCMEVGTSNKWYTETASKQPAAHPPERPQNPAIQLITAAAHPPERPQKPRNPPHHRRGPSPTAKRGTSCAAAQLARPGRHNQCSASTGCEKRQLAIAKTWQER